MHRPSDLFTIRTRHQAAAGLPAAAFLFRFFPTLCEVQECHRVDNCESGSFWAQARRQWNLSPRRKDTSGDGSSAAGAVTPTQAQLRKYTASVLIRSTFGAALAGSSGRRPPEYSPNKVMMLLSFGCLKRTTQRDSFIRLWEVTLTRMSKEYSSKKEFYCQRFVTIVRCSQRNPVGNHSWLFSVGDFQGGSLEYLGDGAETSPAVSGSNRE